MRAWLRHELPVHSPLGAGDVAAGIVARLTRSDRALEAARALVASEYAAQQVLLVDSGRSALQLAITAALDATGRDRIVALPAFQCYEVASAAVGAGARIAFYDIDPITLQPDAASFEQALREGGAVAVVAPLYGLPVDWDALKRLADANGASLIEDAAQAHGAMWRGRPLGAIGDTSVVSFGRGKGWTAAGGGALLLRAPTTGGANGGTVMAPRGDVRAMVSALAQVAFGRAALYGVPASIPALALGETVYHDPATPSRMSAFSAGVLQRTWARARAEIDARRANAALWDRMLAGTPAVIPPLLAGGSGGYLRYPVRLPNRPSHLDSAWRHAGIAGSYPLPLGALPAVRPLLTHPARRHPGAETLSRELVTLPTHSRLTAAARETVARLLRSAGYAA